MSFPYSVNLSKGRFETWTKKPEQSFHHVTQVHGTDIVSLETTPCEADGLVVSWDDLKLPLAIKTADCLPIVIEGEKGVVFLHAGWRGLAHGILERPEIDLIIPTNAYIGPSIQECCFEVSEDFQGNFPGSPLMRRGEKHYFNLQEEAQHRLQKRFKDLPVELDHHCTCCDHQFHSYRRNKTTERNWNFYIKG